MTKTKKTILLIALIGSLPLVLLSKNNNETTPIVNETNKVVNNVDDTTLDTNDIVKDIKKEMKKVSKSKTIINGEKVTYIKNAENVYNKIYKNITHKHKTVNKKVIKKIIKKTINNDFRKTIKNTYISKQYFVDSTRCSENCGVAIKKWNDAKTYCNKRGSSLPSKSEIENSSKYQKKECSDCSYWTNTEALRPNGRSYPSPKVYVYLQSEGDFFKFNTKSTYVATCLSD